MRRQQPRWLGAITFWTGCIVLGWLVGTLLGVR